LNKGIDVIGDIHGYAQELKKLLAKLGYKEDSGVYFHPIRTAMFVGDYIDRGPENLEVIRIVRSMVEAETAKAIMGNHEYNALAFHSINLDNPDNPYFRRSHSPENLQQHKSFLVEQSHDRVEAGKALEWFKTLPLFVEEEGARFVHAAWHQPSINFAKEILPENHVMTDDFFERTFRNGSVEQEVIEKLLKGPEWPICKNVPPFRDKDKNERTEFRVAWWKIPPIGSKLGSVGLSKELSKLDFKIPNEAFDGFKAQAHEPLTFFGHYWKSGKLNPVSKSAVCVDYSVAKKGGKLCCYRWDGEKIPDRRKFETVNRVN
jgi:hypothetical protein